MPDDRLTLTFAALTSDAARSRATAAGNLMIPRQGTATHTDVPRERRPHDCDSGLVVSTGP